MAGLPVRDPVADHLLTPQNTVMAVVDYHPIGWVSLAAELQRDWARGETAEAEARSCSTSGC
jgi:hypothetical protein